MALKNRFERIARGEGTRPLGFQPLADGADTIRFLSIHPSRIERDPTQPRKDLGELSGLCASIKDQGIIQPLIVAPLDDQRFQLIAGERRLTAAQQLGLTEIPVLVRSVEEHRRLIVQIVENLHRKDLSPLEEAEGVQRLVEDSSLSQRDVAARLGKSLTYVNELLRVLQLPDDVLAAVRTSEQPVSKSLLLEITKQPNQAKQRRLWQQANSGDGLTVKEARQHKQTARPSALRRPSKQTAPGSTDWTMQTEAGLVSVRLHGDDLQDRTRIRQALEQALRSLSY